MVKSKTPASQKKIPEVEKIYGAIIPHDPSVQYMNTELFKKLILQNPKLIILLGPNHFEKGNTDILINDIPKEEYSISENSSLLKQLLPNAEILPIIFKKRTSLLEINNLISDLTKNIDENTIIIATVDFSHYLSLEKARLKDAETLLAIKKYDFEKILLFNSDNLDSPASIVTLLLLMRGNRHENMEILHYANSGEINKKLEAPTTSFFSILFH